MASEGAERRLGAFDIGCVVVGGIIGVGIFFTPAKVASAVDDAGQLILAWSIGGVLAVLGALVFAELSRRVPGHGGTFVYIDAAFGRLPAFLYGWANWFVIQSGAAAVIGLVMAQYLDRAVNGGDTMSFAARVLIASTGIVLFTIINALGLRAGSRVQNALTVLKTLAVFSLVVMAMLTSGDPAPTPPPPPDPKGLLAALGAAMLPVLFSFGGWQQGSFVAGAARVPERDVPLGIFAGVVVVVLAYLTVNLAFLDLLGLEAAGQSKAIAADAAKVALGEEASRILSLAVVVSSAGILNTICLAPPYVLHTMAQRGVFFPAVGKLHVRFGSPMIAILVQGLWSVALLLGAWAAFGRERSGEVLGFLLDGVVFVDWIFYAACGFALLGLTRDKRTLPGARAAGWLFGLAAIVVAVGAIGVNPAASAVGLGLCFLGLPFFTWLQRDQSARP